MALTAYLKRRHNAWSVRVQIPRHLWARAGKRQFVKALGTTDLMEASRRKHAYVAEFKRAIEALEKHGGGSEALKLREHVAVLQALIAQYGDRWREKDDDQAEAAIEAALDDARDALGDEAAERAMDLALGRTTLVREQYLQWLDETAPKPKQRDNHAVVLRDFLAWAGQDTTVEEVTRHMAGEYISRLLASGRARKTVERYRSSLSTLWTWLAEKGRGADLERNPWRQHRSIKPTVTHKRKALTNEQLTMLLSGTCDTATYGQLIPDLCRLALATGCRLEELCAAPRRNVTKRPDGYWLKIEQGKTEAATREVPIHRSVNAIVKRRLRSGSEFFLGDITPGAYGRRSHHVSKAYARFRKAAGVGERGEDFHALRHTFTTALEGAGVPISTIQLLIGHSRKKTMGVTATYTTGERTPLRVAVNKLCYSPAVMRLMAAPPGAGRTR
jgi:integrase